MDSLTRFAELAEDWQYYIRRVGLRRALPIVGLEVARLPFRHLSYRRAFCYIEAGNSPSLAVWQRKLGCTSAGRIDFLRIGSWYRVRLYGATHIHLRGQT
jgi:hypothetical protein